MKRMINKHAIKRMADTIAGVGRVGQAARAIEFLLALQLFVFGLYVLSPWYITESPAEPYGHPEVASVIGAAAVIFGGFQIFAAWVDDKMLRQAVLMTNGCLFMFVGILRMVSIGFVPIIWVTSIASALMCFVMRINLTSGR